jgi:hypothetical protein
MRQFRARPVKSGSSYHGKKKGVKAFGPDQAALTGRRRARYPGRDGSGRRLVCARKRAFMSPPGMKSGVA